LHELATNDFKDGSLSAEHGRVAIAWSVHRQSDDGQFQFRSEERDGPMMKSVAPSQLEVEPRLIFAPDAFISEFETALGGIVQKIRFRL
jgi:hypothetical protein